MFYVICPLAEGKKKCPVCDGTKDLESTDNDNGYELFYYAQKYFFYF